MSKGKLVLFSNSVDEDLINILTYKITFFFLFFFLKSLWSVNNPLDFLMIFLGKIKEDYNYGHLNKRGKEGNKRSITK